jgi:CheY-like chemotaxis protein
MALVLVIDDHEDSRRILQKLLGLWGHRTLGAETGEAGLALLATAKPDLIIVDGMMPGMNGAEFIRVLRATSQTAMVPAILYTAVCDPEYANNALEKGANEVWVKTDIKPEQMQDRVLKYVA